MKLKQVVFGNKKIDNNCNFHGSVRMGEVLRMEVNREGALNHPESAVFIW